MTLQRPRGREGRTELRILLAGFASAALLVGAVAPALAATPVRQAAAAPGIHKAQIQITKTSSTAKLGAYKATKIGAPTSTEYKANQDPGDTPKGQQPNPASVAGLKAPMNVPSMPVVPASTLTGRSGAVGWSGISGAESRYAFNYDGTPATRWNYSIEPPDMALCVGNGQVVQGVNGAIVVTNTNGVPLTAITPFNAFLFGPDINLSEIRGGPSVGDPVCRYDPATRRFFLSQYMSYYGMYSLVLAVSNSSDATGTWTTWNVSDPGDYTLPGCAGDCFPDYPQMGLDSNGVWLTANEFSDSNGYVGATIIGLSKRALFETNGFMTMPPYADAWGFDYTAQNGYPFTIQPASTPSGGYDASGMGTQYFVATRDPAGTVDNVVNVWSISNTSSLNLVFGKGWPTDPIRVELTGQAYACGCANSAPGNGASQKDGPHPLGESMGYRAVQRLNTNDDRMHPVVYSNGMLWSAATSEMTVAGSDTVTTGVAWWTIAVGTNGSTLNAGIRGQGYIGVKNSYLFFPAVAVSNSVRGVIAMTFSGPDRWPSVAYAQFNPYTGASEVRVAANGVLPADGFTGYPPYLRYGTGRWGDYSAAATDEMGNVWFASEYVGPKPRAAYVNWGTYVATVMPY